MAAPSTRSALRPAVGRPAWIHDTISGHYVPQLADLVYERNKDNKASTYINLKGFIVGNPLTNDYYDSKGLAEYAWSHAVVSDQVYERSKKTCNFKNSNWTDDCNAAMNIIFSQYHEIDIYDIYAPKCLLNNTSASPADRAFFANDLKQFRRRIRMFSGYMLRTTSIRMMCRKHSMQMPVDCLWGSGKYAVTKSSTLTISQYFPSYRYTLSSSKQG